MLKQTACFIAILVLIQCNFAGAESELRVARSAYEDGLYKIAERQLIQFIKDNPGSEMLHQSYFLLGECRFNLEDYSGAAAAYAEASGAPREKEAALYRKACAYYLMGEEDKCRELFSEYLETFPRGKFAGAAAFRLGECMLKEKKFGEAGDSFTRAARAMPEPEHINTALYSAGIAYLKAGNHRAAVSSFTELLEGSPDANIKPGALYWLGHAHLKEGGKEEAKAAFAMVFEVFPGSAFADAALYQRGIHELANKNYAAAGGVFKTLIKNYKESPHYHAAKLKLGVSLDKTGERTEAARFFRGVADSEACGTLKAEALYRKGLSLISEGKYPRGLETLAKLKTLFPGTREAKLGTLAECAALYRRGDYRGVIRTAGEASLDEKSAEIKKGLNFLTASSYFALGDFSSAVRIYEEIFPGGAELIAGESTLYYAKSLHECGLHEKAAGILKNFTESHPENGLIREAYFSLAETLFMLGDFITAAAYYGKASEAPELASPAMFRRGESFSRAGMFEEAEAAYDNVGGELKEAAEVKIAEMRYRAGKFSEAAEAAAKLSSGHGPEAVHAKYLLAFSRVHMNKLGEAKRELTEFIEQFPGNRHVPAAFFNLGVIHLTKENYLEAHSYFEKLNRLFPGEPESLEAKYFSGVCLFSMGETERAAKELQEYLLKEGGRGGKARLLLGELYYQKSEYGKALDTLAPLKKSTDSKLAVNACFQLGLVHEAGKNYQKALEMFRLVLQHDGDEAKTLEAMLKTADILSRQKEYGKALELYRILEGENPEPEILRKTRYRSARMLQNLGKYDEAVEAFREITPPMEEVLEADISLRIAQCLRETGNYEEALLEYLKTAYLYPSQRGPALSALESAAAILRQLGREDEALKIYKKIYELDPDGIKGEIASQKLREIKR